MGSDRHEYIPFFVVVWKMNNGVCLSPQQSSAQTRVAMVLIAYHVNVKLVHFPLKSKPSTLSCGFT